jgi:hypothetical protein
MLGRPALSLLMLTVACGGTPAKPVRPAKPAPPPRAKAPAPEPVVELVFMEAPAGAAKPKRGQRRTWRRIGDQARIARLQRLTDNEPARFARALWALAWELSEQTGRPRLHIAVEKGGNYAREGFELIAEDGSKKVLSSPYLILAENPASMRTTFLHESGHAIHALLLGGRGRGHGQPAASIPHSTAAITDRRTAFNEGLAIHLETVNAHCSRDPLTRSQYDRGTLHHGRQKRPLRAEYYAPVKDMLTYAQTFARYQHVRDGLYAFAAAPASKSYLRLQLTPARDRRRLRSPGELVASEGFVASVFFQLVAGSGCKSLMELVPRYRHVLLALQASETVAGPLDEIPLLDFVHTFGPRAVTVFLDLSRGVTLDAGAAALWRQVYDTAVHLDIANLKKTLARAEAARRRWQKQATTSPLALRKRIGPVVVVQVPSVKVGVAMFGKAPLIFDVNAVSPAILRTIPALTDAVVENLTAERERAPFRDRADFTRRARAAGAPDRLFAPLPTR